jgi:hypothetical protein
VASLFSRDFQVHGAYLYQAGRREKIVDTHLGGFYQVGLEVAYTASTHTPWAGVSPQPGLSASEAGKWSTALCLGRGTNGSGEELALL